MDAYLASLDMTITFQPFDATGRARIVQLINKSNQYNLTTRRYTDPEVAEAENDPEVFTLQVRLADIFGDNGMISVVICRPAEAGVWEIDTWLMSCRVLGRKVEHMVLREILEHARAAGIRKLIGYYRPTDRNKLVVDHYAKLGFTKVAEEDSGATRWELLVEGAEPESAPMKVVSQGFATYREKLARMTPVTQERLEGSRSCHGGTGFCCRLLEPADDLSYRSFHGVDCAAGCFRVDMDDAEGLLGGGTIRSTGVRGIPNSVCSGENPRKELVEYRFNSCGHRAGMECGPKPPGTYRIVMVGSSSACGHGGAAGADLCRVAARGTLAADRTQESSSTTKPCSGGRRACIDLRFNEVLAAKPDMILCGC